jgi:hypothetical protein
MHGQKEVYKACIFKSAKSTVRHYTAPTVPVETDLTVGQVLLFHVLRRHSSVLSLSLHCLCHIVTNLCPRPPLRLFVCFHY